MDTPLLRTERLQLRRYRPEDFDFFAALLGDPTVTRYSSGGALKPADARRLFAKTFELYGDGTFAIWCVLAGETPIGHAELKPRKGEKGLEIVYFLAEDQWGKGYGTELVPTLAAHGLTETERVIATVDPKNGASAHLLKKSGFRFVKQTADDGPCDWYELTRGAR